MTLRDILQKTIQILDEDINLEETGIKRTRLIACANMIYQELTTEYVPLKNREILCFEDKRLYFSNFVYKVKDVLGIYINGESIGFRIYPMYIEADIKGNAEVVYLYHSEELAIDDEATLPPQYTAFVLASGVASEYLYRSGFVEEAMFYKTRYDTAVLNLSRIRKGITLKKRRMF